MLERETKIKAEFIKALEETNWEKLPEFPVLQGFVKNIASTLKLDKKNMAALLRRDYPPKSLKVNPSPDVNNKFFWSPKLSFITGIAVVVLAILTYLGIEYKKFITPPALEVINPQENQTISEEKLKVNGITNPDTSIKVNNQPVLVNDDGLFITEIEVFEGTEEVIVVATSRSGKKTEVRRKIIPDFRDE